MLRNTFFVILVLSTVIHAQWLKQNCGTTNTLSSISFHANEPYGFISGGNRIDGTILYTSDGGVNWLLRTLSGSNGDEKKINYVNRLSDNASAIILGDFGLIKKTTDTGLTWKDLATPPRYENFNSASFPFDSKGYAIDDQGYLFKTSDGGKTWSKSTNSFNTLIESMNMRADIGYIAGKNGKVFYTTNEGITWKDVSIPNGPLLWLNSVEIISPLLSTPNVVLVSGYETSLSDGKYYGVIYKSEDSGNTWRLIKKTNSPINKIKKLNNINDGFWDVLAVGDNGQILISYDDGETWYQQESLTNFNLYDITYRFDTSLYIVGDGGTILRSENVGGQLLVPEKPTLYSPTNSSQNQTINLIFTWSTSRNSDFYYIQIAKDNLFNNIFVRDSLVKDTIKQVSNLSINTQYWWRVKAKNLAGYSIWSEIKTFSTTQTSVELDNAVLPIDYSLSQNYPNPFNPTTKIQFSIPKENYAVLKVYDVLGNEIETLVNRFLSAATYNINFDASKLNNGIYFYRLQTDRFSQTKKMILLK